MLDAADGIDAIQKIRSDNNIDRNRLKKCCLKNNNGINRNGLQIKI